MVQPAQQPQTGYNRTATLALGQGAGPQEELLAEAPEAQVRAGCNPADFDLTKASSLP